MKEPLINVPDIICQAFHHIDPRVNGHGERVAYILMQMFKDKPEIAPQEKQNFFMIGLLHDIGAYKEAEIDSMLSFDQDDSLEHSVYGYLLFQTFSPLPEYANIILHHHHCNAQYYSVPISTYHRSFARILYLADRIDVFSQSHDTKDLFPFLENYKDSIFTLRDVRWFQETNEKYHILEALHSGSYRKELAAYTSTLTFTEEQIHSYLLLFIFSIDFRNEYSALHTAYTVQVSRSIANTLNLDTTSCKIAELSALLHNIGKISIPSCIKNKEDYDSYLEDIYKNSTQEITRDILKGNVSTEVFDTINQSFLLLNCWTENKPITFTPAPAAEVVALSCLLSNSLSLESHIGVHCQQSLLSFLHNKYRSCSMDDTILSSLEQHYNQILQETRITCTSLSDTYRKMTQEYHSLNMVLMHYNQKYQ